MAMLNPYFLLFHPLNKTFDQILLEKWMALKLILKGIMPKNKLSRIMQAKIYRYLKIFLLVVAFTNMSIVYAQNPSPILQEYITLGLENNLALKQNSFNVDKSISALAEAKSAYYPVVNFIATYTAAAGGRTSKFPLGDLLNPVYGTLNKLTNTQSFPQISNQNLQFLPNDFQETYLQVIQPLFNADIYYNYRAKKALISVQEAQRDTYKQELVKEIKNAYYQ